MSRSFKERFGIPDLDFSHLAEPVSEQEEEKIYQEMLQRPKKDWRKFVDDAEAHPEMLSIWDMSISFDEFARRVRAGEFD